MGAVSNCCSTRTEAASNIETFVPMMTLDREKKLGKPMLVYYWAYKASVLKALMDEEGNEEGPVYFVDVLKRWSN